MNESKTHITNLMNYEQHSSNSNNYSPYQTSSNPESFPDIMENGIIVSYQYILFSSEIMDENNNDKKITHPKKS